RTHPYQSSTDAGIDRHRKIGAATLFVGGVDGPIRAPVEICACRRYQMPTRRKSHYSDLVRIDVPLRSVETYQANGALCVLPRRRELGGDMAFAGIFPMRPRIGDAVLEQHARHSVSCQPVANLRTLQIDGENLV